jgi:hypothetical protein
MEGSVLSFLKAEWMVNDTGSAHWASSYFLSEWEILACWSLVLFFIIKYESQYRFSKIIG